MKSGGSYLSMIGLHRAEHVRRDINVEFRWILFVRCIVTGIWTESTGIVAVAGHATVGADEAMSPPAPASPVVHLGGTNQSYRSRH